MRPAGRPIPGRPAKLRRDWTVTTRHGNPAASKGQGADRRSTQRKDIVQGNAGLREGLAGLDTIPPRAQDVSATSSRQPAERGTNFPTAADGSCRGRRAHQLEMLQAIAEEITRERDLSRLVDLIAQRALALVEGAGGYLCLWNDADQVLVPQAWTRWREWIPQHRLRLNEGLAGTVAARREGLIVNDYRHWPAASRPVLEHTRITAAMAEPLVYRDSLVGVIVVDTEEGGRRFTREDRNALSLLAS